MKRNLKVFAMALAILATMTSCGGNVQSDSSERTTTQVSVSTKTEIDTSTDTSEIEINTNDSSDSESKPETETTTVESISDSSSDESKSEKATTTTKSSKNETKTEKTVTTTKQSSTTTSAVATQPVATRPTAQPIVTTKATPKPTVTAKQTTKATPKVTQATSKSVLPSNATPLRKALYEIVCCGKNIPANFKIVQQELIKYGKSLYPQSILNPNLHGWVDNNGKYYDTTNNGQWTFLHYADNVDFYDTWLVGYSPVSTLETVDYFEYQLKNYVKNQLCGFQGIGNPNEGCCWYVTVGMHTSGYTAEITCICSFI